jgi:hypothetical protein
MSELDWQADGAIVVRKLIPENDVNTYLDFFNETYVQPNRKPRDDDYLRFPQVRDLACHKAIADTFNDIGLSGHIENALLDWNYKPTGWHSDRLPHMTRTAGVIIALDDLHPESGLFEMIPGSHRWDLDLSECRPLANGTTGDYLTHIIADHLEATYKFHGSKGDVLIWNSELIHRRSPRTADVPRQTVVTLCDLPPRPHRLHKDGLGFVTHI